MRSKGEEKVAEVLEKNKIKFHYEFPIAVIDEEKTKIWYPDFYLYEFGIIIEYFGLYNSDEKYKKDAQHKKKVFRKLGLEFISVYKTTEDLEEWLLKSIYWIIQSKQTKIERIINKNKINVDPLFIPKP